MPQHRNAQSFHPGDPRAAAAGRKGGRQRQHSRLSLDYVRGYQSGARATRRHFDRWTQERTMSQLERIGESDFLRIARRLHADQLRATTPVERRAADEAFGHMLRMFGHGRLDEWIASHPENDADLDDSMSANAEDAI